MNGFSEERESTTGEIEERESTTGEQKLGDAWLLRRVYPHRDR